MNRILIIDDEVTICSLLSRYLVKHDFEAEEAYTGKRALELLETNTFDLVLCDYRLGDMNAAELLPEIRRIQPGVPVIIITGYSDSKTAVEMMRLGVYDYISKPLVPTEILQTIQKALEEEPGATARDTPVAGKPKEERSIPEPGRARSSDQLQRSDLRRDRQRERSDRPRDPEAK
jgi:two-component system response regulator HydG